jgi:hypothetical protein
MLKQNNNILLIHNPHFEGDISRFFIAKVMDLQNNLVKAKGQTWIKNPKTGQFLKKEDERTKIFSIGSAQTILYLLPDTVKMELMEIMVTKNGATFITDTSNFNMNISDRVYGK